MDVDGVPAGQPADYAHLEKDERDGETASYPLPMLLNFAFENEISAIPVVVIHKAASAAAATLKERGSPVRSDPIGALVHLQLGRAYSLAGDDDKARVAY